MKFILLHNKKCSAKANVPDKTAEPDLKQRAEYNNNYYTEFVSLQADIWQLLDFLTLWSEKPF